MDISEGTVRNDLNAHEQQGLLLRVYGGAILRQQDQFQNNSFLRRYQQEATVEPAIAREAAVWVNDNDLILLDAGSTAYCFAKALSECRARRELLTESPNAVLAEKVDSRYNLDAVEPKFLGMGSESYVVGSMEFYMGYAVSRKILLASRRGPLVHDIHCAPCSRHCSGRRIYSDNMRLKVTPPAGSHCWRHSSPGRSAQCGLLLHDEKGPGWHGFYECH